MQGIVLRLQLLHQHRKAQIIPKNGALPKQLVRKRTRLHCQHVAPSDVVRNQRVAPVNDLHLHPRAAELRAGVPLGLAQHAAADAAALPLWVHREEAKVAHVGVLLNNLAAGDERAAAGVVAGEEGGARAVELFQHARGRDARAGEELGLAAPALLGVAPAKGALDKGVDGRERLQRDLADGELLDSHVGVFGLCGSLMNN